MLAHTNAVVARIQSIPALAVKTYKLVAPRDAQGKLPVAPYAVLQPSDGTDTQERFSAPRSTQHPRFVLHIVGSSYDNAQTVTELVKAKFITPVTFVPIQVNVAGESGRNLTWSAAQPTQQDDDLQPPLIYNTVELGWDSETI